MKRRLGTLLCATLALGALSVPFVALARELSSSEASGWQCATCVGTRTMPYWGSGVALLLIGVAFFLFVREKPFPELDETPPE